MDKTDIRNNDMYAQIVKLDERQRTLFNTLIRVEKHLERMNGQVSQHSNSITQIKTVGSIGVLIMPIIITLIMRIW